ncbi:MAG: hypothetical protein E7361_02995 [Clostridiales bacterium]|nr:hypothetical protein [Clostridiales bacterium]
MDIKKFIRDIREKNMSIDEILDSRYPDHEDIDSWQKSDLRRYVDRQKGLKRSIVSKVIGANPDYAEIKVLIRDFTRNPQYRTEEDLEKKKIDVKDKCGNYVIGIDNDQYRMTIRTKEGDINITKFTAAFNCPYSMKKILTSRKRNGMCHFGSLWIAKNVRDFECDIVSSNVADSGKKGGYIHTWIELKGDLEDKCVDFTLNACINKDAYYRLMNIDQNNISRISNTDYKKEKNIVSQLYNKDPRFIRMYLFDREDALSWYEKLSKDDAENKNALENTMDE